MSMHKTWRVCDMVAIRDGLTISRDSHLGMANRVTWFSLGADTDISQEMYDSWSIYVGGTGRAAFLIGETADRQILSEGALLVVRGGTLCGVESAQGAVYTEIIMKEDPITMNEQITPGKVMQMKDLISYEEGSVVNFSIVSNKSLRFVLMAFDEGTALNPHSAPGDAIVTALEGTGVIGYEGEEFELKEGESFRFAKGGLHSVSAPNGRFKMSLVLVLE